MPQVPTVIEYFGDVDVEGLDIAAAMTARADQEGLPPVVPAAELYQMLRDAGSSVSESGPVASTRAHQLTRWLPALLREWAADLLTSGRRAAQERVGFERLTAL